MVCQTSKGAVFYSPNNLVLNVLYFKMLEIEIKFEKSPILPKVIFLQGCDDLTSGL